VVRISCIVLLGLFCTTAPALGQGKYNKKVKLGDAAPVFKDLPGTDGKKHSLADLSSKDVIVVVFTANDCLYAQMYEDRMIQFAKKYAGPDSKVAFVAISVSLDEEDLLPKMVERAKEKKYNFPYLHDKTQQIGRLYGASVTPEFFVLNKERKFVYLGAMDDTDDEPKVSKRYVEEAVQATLKGQTPAIAETRPIGCSVIYEKVK
jgi:peroxiredoxin